MLHCSAGCSANWGVATGTTGSVASPNLTFSFVSAGPFDPLTSVDLPVPFDLFDPLVSSELLLRNAWVFSTSSDTWDCSSAGSRVLSKRGFTWSLCRLTTAPSFRRTCSITDPSQLVTVPGSHLYPQWKFFTYTGSPIVNPLCLEEESNLNFIHTIPYLHTFEISIPSKSPQCGNVVNVKVGRVQKFCVRKAYIYYKRTHLYRILNPPREPSRNWSLVPSSYYEVLKLVSSTSAEWTTPFFVFRWPLLQTGLAKVLYAARGKVGVSKRLGANPRRDQWSLHRGPHRGLLFFSGHARANRAWYRSTPAHDGGWNSSLMMIIYRWQQTTDKGWPRSVTCPQLCPQLCPNNRNSLVMRWQRNRYHFEVSSYQNELCQVSKRRISKTKLSAWLVVFWNPHSNLPQCGVCAV